MKKLFDLRKEKKSTLDQANAMLALCTEEDRDFTADEQSAYDELLAKADGISKRLENLEKVEQRMKSLPADEGVVVSDASSISGGEPAFMQDPNRGWKHIGEFAQAVKDAADRPHAIDERLRVQATISGMSVSGSSGVYGGHLLPPGYSQMIYDGIMANVDLASLVDTYRVEANTQSLTFPAVDESSRASTTWGGVTGAWLAEGDAMNGYKPKTRQVTVTPHEYGVLIYTTNTLLKNSSALSQFISRAAIHNIGYALTKAIINGDGSGEPKGILVGDALISVDRESGQTAATLISTNVEKMWARRALGGKYIWLANQEYQSSMSGLNVVLTDVGGTTTVGAINSGIYDASANTLKGAPVIFTEHCSAPGTAGDIILVDPKAYLAGVREGIQSDMSIHVKFTQNETAFRFIVEYDGTPWVASALTPANGTNTLSPYVTMASDADVS
jgi:HK97 family phage major capsid protein